MARVLCPGCLKNTQLTGARAPNQSPTRHDVGQHQTPTKCEEPLYDALAGIYASLGFDAVSDEVFRDLVIARIVEPTSLLDVDRVLAELGRTAASLSTRKRTLRRARGGGYRDQIAAACFAHARTAGDVSLVLYDVTVRREALVVRMEVKDLHRELLP